MEREFWGNIGNDGCRRVIVRKQINERTRGVCVCMCACVALQIDGDRL